MYKAANSCDQTIFIINQCWHFDPYRHTLKRSSEQQSVEIEHQLAVLLNYFIAHPQQVLSKEQLLQDNWPGKVVNDENLTVAVSKLRKLFADNSKQPDVLKTIPGKGYQFVASVEQDSSARPQLARQKLAVMAVILAIAAGAAFWLFLQQNDYRPQAYITPHEHTATEAELRLLLSQSEQAAADDIPALIQAWHQVARQQPEQATAYWYLAKLKIALLGPWLGEQPQHFDELSALLKKALALEPNNAEAWYWLGNLYFWHQRDYVQAEACFEKAISLQDRPLFYIHYSELLLAQGKFAGVFNLAEQVRAKQPHLFAFPGLAWVYQLSGQPDKGWQELQRIRQTEVDTYAWHASAVRISQQLGLDEESFASLRWLLQQSEQGKPHIGAVETIFASSGMTGVYHYLLQHKFTGDIGHYLPPLSWARYAIASGDLTQAEYYFQQAVQQYQLPLLWAAVDGFYQPLHGSKVFSDWLATLNLAVGAVD